MKKCKCCNKEIPDRNKFCSISCSAKINNQGVRRHGSGPKSITCKGCNKEFETTKSKGRKYCSNKCQGLYRRKETKEKIEAGKIVSPRTMRFYLIEQRGHRCEICGIEKWQEQPVPLIMDHIDGNSENNDFSNLRLNCANCDALLPTYAGRNWGNGRHYRRQRYAEGKSS